VKRSAALAHELESLFEDLEWRKEYSRVSQTELSSQAEFRAGALVVRSSAGERGQSQEGRGEDSVGDHIGYEIWMICWSRTASLGLRMKEVLSWDDAEGMTDE
jgi:hypothetical protein